MIAYKQYHLFIGPNMPFEQWPYRINDFLNEFQFSKDSFYYRLECMGNGCAKAAAKYPTLGIVCTDPAKTGYMDACLTGSCEEESFLTILPKLTRHYGIDEIFLCYHCTDSCARPVEILLHRQSGHTARWSSIQLSVQITKETDLTAADSYRDALTTAFPVRKDMERVETEFTDEEQALYKQLDIQAHDIVHRAEKMLKERLISPNLMLVPAKEPALGTTLKKMCKKYGYTFLMHEYHLYILQKRTPNGHFISLEIDNGRNGGECNICVKYNGLGFSHRIGYASCNKPSRMLFLEQFFHALTDVESTVLLELDVLFPPTPTWYSSL